MPEWVLIVFLVGASVALMVIAGVISSIREHLEEIDKTLRRELGRR